MNNLRITLVVLVCVLVAAGCNETHDGGTDAGSEITFDAAFPDAGPQDAGPAPANIGAACRSDDDCDGDDVYCDADFPGGYCTAVCASDLPCPDGSTCIEGRTGNTCFADCDLEASDGDFCSRDGYGCAEAGPICLPGCDTNDDCESGLECDPMGGFNGEGQCGDPSASVGDACESSEMCPPGYFCLSERFSGIPGGACGAFGCDPDTGGGCAEGETCLPAGRGSGVCLLGCTEDTECTRTDQECVMGETGGYCGPSFDEDNLGQICSAGRGDCTGGVCLSESETGWVDSYCVSVGCDPEDGSGCPGDGVCIDGADGMGVCLDGCTDGDDCRAGYACSPSDPADASSATACRPACEDATVCGNDGFECNPGSGLCTEPFDPDSAGEPCNDGGDCDGGRCLSEADSGWPAGTCTYPGCRLSGTGREAECPTGTACIDDGAGDPELGVCVDSCTEALDCRPGYDCVDDLCQPACGDTDCGMGRTCNASSGLCE